MTKIYTEKKFEVGDIWKMYSKDLGNGMWGLQSHRILSVRIFKDTPHGQLYQLEVDSNPIEG